MGRRRIAARVVDGGAVRKVLKCIFMYVRERKEAIDTRARYFFLVLVVVAFNPKKNLFSSSLLFHRDLSQLDAAAAVAVGGGFFPPFSHGPMSQQKKREKEEKNPRKPISERF